MNQQQSCADDEPAIGEVEIRPGVKVGNAFEPEQNPVSDVIADRFRVTRGKAPANSIVKVTEDATRDQAESSGQPAVAGSAPSKKPGQDAPEKDQGKGCEPDASTLPHPEQCATVGRCLDAQDPGDPVVPYLGELISFQFGIEEMLEGVVLGQQVGGEPRGEQRKKQDGASPNPAVLRGIQVVRRRIRLHRLRFGWRT